MRAYFRFADDPARSSQRADCLQRSVVDDGYTHEPHYHLSHNYVCAIILEDYYELVIKKQIHYI